MTEQEAAQSELTAIAKDGATYLREGTMIYRNGTHQRDFYVSFERNHKWYSGMGYSWEEAFTELNEEIDAGKIDDTGSGSHE